MTFSLHKEGVVMSSQITHTIIINIHHLAHILDICALILTSCLFFSLSQPHHVTASHPSPGDNHQSTGGRSERTQVVRKNSFSYIVPGLSALSDLSRIDSKPPPSFFCCPRPPSHHPSTPTSISLVPALHLLPPS